MREGRKRFVDVDRFRVGRTAILWLVQAGALLALAALLPGFEIDDYRKALAAAAVIGLLNAVLWPLLMRFANAADGGRPARERAVAGRRRAPQRLQERASSSLSRGL